MSASYHLSKSHISPCINPLISSTSLASRSNRRSGPGCRNERDGVRRRLQDQEGYVPHCGTAVQGAAVQTDGHAEKHQPQFCSLHHPEPREEGEL